MTEVEQLSVTDIIGTTGKYQILLYVLCFHSTGFAGTAQVTVELLAPMVNMYWNWDEHNPNKTVFSSVNCKMQDIMEYNMDSNNTDSKLIYHSNYSRNTLTEKLGLVCENSWLVSLANVLCLIGVAVGNVLLRLSETYGRKIVFNVVAVLAIVSAFTMSFTQGYIMFGIAMFVFRAATTQTAMLLFILAMEITPPSRTSYVGVYMKSAMLVTQTLFVCAAWAFQDWFYTQLVQTIVTIGYILPIWYVKESPVWLAVRGRYQEARETLAVLLKRNGQDLDEAEPKITLWLEQMKTRCEVETTAEKGNVTDLFKNKTISLYTCGLCFVFVASGYLVTALIMNAETFGSGLYVDLTISNAFSIGSVILAAIIVKKISLRIMFSVCFALEFLICIAFTITYNAALARTIVTVLGRIFISPVMALGFVYVSELYPTSVRGVATGVIILASAVLCGPSPFTKELSEVTALYVPFIIYTGLCLASAVIFVLLPETKGRPMIHTVMELKSFRKRQDVPGPHYKYVAQKC